MRCQAAAWNAEYQDEQCRGVAEMSVWIEGEEQHWCRKHAEYWLGLA